MKRPVYTTIDEYIADFPPDVQAILVKIRQTIKKTAPKGRGDNQLSDPGLQI